MTPITPGQREEIRALLEAELRTLLRSIGLSEEATRTVVLDQTAVGRLSRIDSLQNQAMAKGLAEREQARLAGIQAALERIETDAFGRCTGCGGDIEFGRLLVVPETPTCPACG